MSTGWVYLMASKRNGTLYAGVTSDLPGRVWEHKNDVHEGFTKRYGCKTLVWFETHPNIVLAIKREKQIKEYRRQWKINLIENLNPDWNDLTDRIFEIENPFEPKAGYQNYDDYH